MEEVRTRYVRVTEVNRITPRMVRVTFGGDELADLDFAEPDQQVKLYFPKPGQPVPRLPNEEADFLRWYEAFSAIPEPERPWMRSYTIRAHHPAHELIDIDFVLHPDAGPATRWARSAAPGDTLGMFGPSPVFARRVSLRTAIDRADWLLLAGDETALPAIGSLLESLPEGARAVAYIEINDRAEQQRLDTRGEVTVHWLHRDEASAGHGDLLVEAVRAAEFPPATVFAWLAGEAASVRALRRHLVNERGVGKRSIDFAGYWRPKLTQDDAPTEEDLADAQELMALAADSVTAAEAPAVFDEAYAARTAPWVTGEPQPAIVALRREGWIRGKVLDSGCGTGEHTIHLAEHGYDVRGIDFSEKAIEQARAHAAGPGAAARFEVADALGLSDQHEYDTVIDSGLFHLLTPADRARYVPVLHRVCRQDALVHVLALSDACPGFGPQISDSVIREAFGRGWVLEDLRPDVYRGVVGGEGELGDLPAWLARLRRI